MINNICITGITDLDYYPSQCCSKNCKQNLKSLRLSIPCQKPDIEAIEEIKVHFCINEYKKLKTVLGMKFLVDINCNIKVIYTSLTEEQSLHSAHWDINFCDFILLDGYCYDKYSTCKPNLFIGLEDVCISNASSRYIDLSLLYLVCNTFNCNECDNECIEDDFCLKEKKIYANKLKPNKKNNCNNYQ